MKSKFIVALSCMLLPAVLMAQMQQPQQGYGMPPQGNRMPPKMKTPEEIAQIKSDQMKAEVGLTDKQYKKVYKLIKQDQEYRQEQMSNQFGGGMPPQGGPGMGGPGGQGGFGGGMPPQGGGNFGGGGMPPQGGPGGQGGPGMGGPGGPGGPGMDGPACNQVSDEYLEKQDKKLKKILTEEQYNKWRSKHPAEYMELPPIEIEAERK